MNEYNTIHCVKSLVEVNHKASNIGVTFKHMCNIMTKTDQSTGSAAIGFGGLIGQ